LLFVSAEDELETELHRPRRQRRCPPALPGQRWAPGKIGVVTDAQSYVGYQVRAPINPCGPLDQLHLGLAHERQ
jgi:hypothetical protein